MFSVLIRQFPAIAPDMPFVASPALVGHHLMNDMVARIQSECSIEGLSFRIVCFFRDSLSVDNLPMAVDVSMVFIFFHFIAQYFKELYSKKRAINKKPLRFYIFRGRWNIYIMVMNGAWHYIPPLRNT